MEKYKVFTKEISYIKNLKYKENAMKLIELLPDYFFEIPASSTGKYHPSYALGTGGLVRHTKAVVRFGYELLSNNSVSSSFKEEEKDLLLIAMIMHDGVKSGIPKGTYTCVDHPLLVCNLIRENANSLTLNENEINALCNMIEAHMGEWNTDYNGNEILPKPSNKYQRFVHMCDFLASRKFIHIEFDENNNIID